MNTKFSLISRALLVFSSVLLAISIFVPIWQIQLAAPQYPEGLILKIHANKIGGNVDIINGLNHYIGMKTLHTKDFIEFTFLQYIIGFFALFALFSAIIARKKLLYILFGIFILFGILAMADFWRWEYNYGHNLDPRAAIIVPGMAYQPPLIGYKQLLNFGAYSIPDIGGWLFIASGVFMIIAILIETKVIHKLRKGKTKTTAIGLMLFTVLSSCVSPDPQPINFNKDHCEHCRMTISDKRFACEIVSKKGKAYKFDDIKCMLGYNKENNAKMKEGTLYVCDFLQPNTLTVANTLFYIKGGTISSPMGANIAGFVNNATANAYKIKFSAELISWSTINP